MAFLWSIYSSPVERALHLRTSVVGVESSERGHWRRTSSRDFERVHLRTSHRSNMKVSFSLAGKAKPTTTGTAPPLKQPTAFASLDDEPIDAAPTASTSRNVDANKQLAAQSAGMSKALKKRIEAEMKVDETVYEYDEVWDKMQEAKLKQKEKKEIESKERKVRQDSASCSIPSLMLLRQPKYINNLLQMATTRKLDHWRAEEKKYQRERETEGDEFADKEQFVTQAYKDQMEAVRLAEEEEKQREGMHILPSWTDAFTHVGMSAAMQKKKGQSTGLAHLYRQLLDENDEQHAATVAATQSSKRVIGAEAPPVQNLTIIKPPELTQLSDIELAQLARAEGKYVELNDDNEIVDKRELLSAGLNLSAPNTRRLGRPREHSTLKPGEQVQVHTAVGTAASRREINERRLREIQEQMDAEKERLKREAEQREREMTQRNIAKRNTEEDVMSARERYLQRKRRKLEEAATKNDTNVDMT